MSSCLTLGRKIFSVCTDERVNASFTTIVHAGDRIAQLVIEKISNPEVEEVEVC